MNLAQIKYRPHSKGTAFERHEGTYIGRNAFVGAFFVLKKLVIGLSKRK
jgi:hypothetical protein